MTRGWWRVLPGALVASACYVSTPVDVSVRPVVTGETVALDISDRGRVALSERFGPGVSQIEGRVSATSEESYKLQVFRVSYLRDSDAQWAGETVTIEREHVGRVYQRTLSRRRSVLTAAAVGGGVIAFIVTRALTGEGRERDPDPMLPPGPEQSRVPRF